MVRRREGEVSLSCLVLATGNVGSCRVTKSLDGNSLGLDDEALKAASRFVFKPAMRRGQPVPVMVNIIISFRLR
jgi:TonB family protein